MTLDDALLLEAYREVDAMLPDSPPIAPRPGYLTEVRTATDLEVYTRLHAELAHEDATRAYASYRRAQWVRGR